MVSHLHDDELIALASGAGDRPGHLSQCGQCESRLRQFEQTLQLTASVPTMEWNSLQAGAFAHRVWYGLHQRRLPAASGWWRPALAGMAVAMVMMTVIQSLIDAPRQPLAKSPTAMTSVRDNSVAVDTGLGDDDLLFDADIEYKGTTSDGRPAWSPDWSDAEVYSMISSYLVDTASDDELLATLGDMTDEDLYAVLGE